MDDALAAELHEVDPKALGRRIRDRRLALSMTQATLASDDVTVGYVSRIESGQRRPDASLCEAFAARLGSTAEFLVTGIEPHDAAEITLALQHAELCLESGDAMDAERRSRELLADQGRLSVEHESQAHYIHARALEALGDFEASILELQDLVAASVPGQLTLSSTIALSRCLRESGDFKAAIDVGEVALESIAAQGLDGGDEAIQLSVTVASGYFMHGDVGHAVRIAKRAIEDAERRGSPKARASAYWNASIYESGRGHTAAAVPLAQRALALMSEGDDARNLARLRSWLGIMLLRVDPPEDREALTHLRRARKELERSSANPIDLVRCDIAMAKAVISLGALTKAKDLMTSAAIEADVHGPIEAAESQAVLGHLAALDGDGREAKIRYRRAVALLTSIGADRDVAQLWLELGELLEQSGDSAAAREAYRSAAISTGLRLPAVRSHIDA
jgi:tetratricopeptide (TPR) repeat protein